MRDQPVLIGRRAELAAIEDFVSSIPDGPGALLLEGEAGIGKTTLFLGALRSAADHGVVTLVGRPTQAEAQLAYGGLGDLLGGIPEAVLEELPAPQRKAVDVALLRVEPDDAQELLPRAVALGALGAFRALARTAPVLVAIDDVQWLDEPSEGALAFVVRRLVDEPIAFVGARRVDDAPPGCLFGLTDVPVFGTRLRRIVMTPLTSSDLDRLLRERLGHLVPRNVLSRVHEMSGGNPYLALELARAGFDRGVRVPPSLQQVVGERLSSLSAPAREAANVAAVLSRPTVSVVRSALEGDGRADGVREAIDAGVLDRDGDRLSFTHPLLQSVAYALIPADERRRLHARVGLLLADPEERGRHFGLAAEEPNDLVALSLDAAARRARSRGAPDAAAQLLESARRLTPAGSTDDAHRRGIMAAERHFEAGNTRRADALLVELVEAAPSPRARVLALTRLGWVRAHAHGQHEATEAFRAALAAHPHEDALRVEIEQGLAWGVHSTANADEALAHARTACEIAERLGDPSLVASALSYQALVTSLLGNGLALADAARAVALGQTPAWSQILGRTDWVHALLLQWDGQLALARDRFLALDEHAEAHGDEHAAPAILFQLARVELLLGNWDEAERHARNCIDATLRSGQVGEQPYSLTIAGMVDAHRGNVERARAELAEARKLADDLGVQPADLEAQAVQGFLELSLGDHAAAEVTFDALAAAAERAGFREPAVLRYRGDAIEALLALGKREEAATRLAELEALASSLDRPVLHLVSARCRGLLAAASGDLAAAQAALDESLAVDVEGEPFEKARSLLALGTVQRRAKQKRAARESLAAAAHAFAELGAPLWEDRAGAELARVGGRADDHALTPTERKVAELIAAGRTYREAADELFISPKTVQWNLSKVYRKLGIRSRAELPARLVRARGDGTT